MSGSAAQAVPTIANLDTDNVRDIICYMNSHRNVDTTPQNEVVQFVAMFFFIILSTLSFAFPIIPPAKFPFKIPGHIYDFFRYFGGGVLIATAFVHLLDSAYESIGPNTCVGMSYGWAEFSWPPAIAMTSALLFFMFEVSTELWAKAVTPTDAEKAQYTVSSTTRALWAQLTSFLVFEIAVIMHAVVIGLNMSTVSERSMMYFAFVFFTIFEGLSLGARFHTVQLPKSMAWAWIPWVLCLFYSFATPIAMTVGIAQGYDRHAFHPSVASGVLDSISAGIMLYVSFVDVLARDFMFNTDRPRSPLGLSLMFGDLFMGAILMAIMGKWK
ncbi:ZIP zinc transporter-domain-containing protein [Lasiosphaeria ovina]|uniref:ZIP zinc transporter-domain-containing protein n=1 Tax=Lasiosphaeria ovina TaxID=92902 RepID=A0AAE0TV89_9PEZI|nr:ZIP zinc transporter-domain-containing protein [Lasiosphaeria ovina]